MEEHRKCENCFSHFHHDVEDPRAPICSVECPHTLCSHCVAIIYQNRQNKRARSIPCPFCEKAKAFLVDSKPNLAFCGILKELKDCKKELEEYKEERESKRRRTSQVVEEEELVNADGGIVCENTQSGFTRSVDANEDRKMTPAEAAAVTENNPSAAQERATGRAEPDDTTEEEKTTNGVGVANGNSNSEAPTPAVAAAAASTNTSGLASMQPTSSDDDEDVQHAIARTIGLNDTDTCTQQAIAQSLAVFEDTTPQGNGSSLDPLILDDDEENNVQLDIQRAISQSLRELRSSG